MYARGIVPGERVCPCKNTRYAYGYNTRLPTRNFCEFCNTCIPVPGTSVSCVRLSYPYPEYTKPNRTQSTAVIVCFFFCYWLLFQVKLIRTWYMSWARVMTAAAVAAGATYILRSTVRVFTVRELQVITE